MSSKGANTEKPNTRDLILQAAIARFCKNSYDETGLRDIAGDVGVDVAYVHRSFGSKERLFLAALDASTDGGVVEQMLSDEPLSSTIACLVADTQTRKSQGTEPLDIILRSLSSQKASAILRDKVQAELVEKLSEKMTGPVELRASMIVAVLLGTGIARNLLKLPAFETTPEHQIRQMVENILDAIINGDS